MDGHGIQATSILVPRDTSPDRAIPTPAYPESITRGTCIGPESCTGCGVDVST